jgi:hypothetical protein
MPMGNEQFKPPKHNLNASNSGRIKIESERHGRCTLKISWVWSYILRRRRAHLNNFNINFLRGTVGGFSLSIRKWFFVNLNLIF